MFLRVKVLSTSPIIFPKPNITNDFDIYSFDILTFILRYRKQIPILEYEERNRIGCANKFVFESS